MQNTKTIILPYGCTEVRACDIPNLIAEALHPVPHAAAPTLIGLRVLRIHVAKDHDKQMQDSIISGGLLQLHPHTRIATRHYLSDGTVTVETLRNYVAKFTINVVVRAKETKSSAFKRQAAPPRDENGIPAPKLISDAPPPIRPLPSGRNAPIQIRRNETKPNWREWKHTPNVRLWEACALSLNIDPHSMKQIASVMPTNDAFFEGGSFPNDDIKSEFNLRLRLTQKNYHYFFPDNINVVTSRRQVSLSEFVKWAVSVVEWDNLPSELSALANEPTQVRQNTAKHSENGAAPDGDAQATTQQGEPTETAHTANPPNSKPGLTRLEILTQTWPLTSTFTEESFDKALSDVPLWLERARLMPGRVGKNGSATWNPALIAVALFEKNYVTKNGIQKFMSSAFPLWLDEWNVCKEQL